MTRADADVAIIGSGFAGSLTALILTRLGLRVVVIDKARHPRFAIGESSTPAADMVLANLCDRYDLGALRPLCKYGTWQRRYPGIACGLKRGFSYFHHRPGEPFRQDREHSTELLVTASATDDAGDTHWYRADVDEFFARQSVAAGAGLWEGASILSIDSAGDWVLHGRRDDDTEFELRAPFLIDASGPGSVLPRRLGIEDWSQTLHTKSRTIFAHFRDLRRFGDVLADAGQSTMDHPFLCDDAALHHIVDGGWMWVLRFNNGITSAGFVIDERRHGPADGHDAAREWQSWLARYPGIAEQFRGVELAVPFRQIVGTGRLQRRWARCAGPNWALLPHTAGFIDPLYSTGIAQSLCGIERLAAAFELRSDCARFEQALRSYDAAVQAELVLTDRIVAAAFDTFGRDPRLFAAASTLYFAAATTFEQRRAAVACVPPPAFLLADDLKWLNAVNRVVASLPGRSNADPTSATTFQGIVGDAIRPYNSVGLCNASYRNMYRYTAAPEKTPAAGCSP
jgi:FADH2 O2-dependent halogenase